MAEYEYLTKENGSRVVAFGHWAWVVGTYNGLRGQGLVSEAYLLKSAMNVSICRRYIGNWKKMKRYGIQ